MKGQIYPNYNVNMGAYYPMPCDLYQHAPSLKERIFKESTTANCRIGKKHGEPMMFYDKENIGKKLFAEDIRNFEVVQLSIKYVDFNLILIIIDKNSVILRLNEIKPLKVYAAFLRAGCNFNLTISKNKVGEALCDYINKMIGANNKFVEVSGKAGWEAGYYMSAESLEYLVDYAFCKDIPLLQKHFCRLDHIKNLARLENYSIRIQRIKNEKNRVIFALTPFAGMINSLLTREGLMMPFVLNIVLMTDDITIISEIMHFMQIFSRNMKLQPVNVSVSSKEITKIINSSKDEVIIFAGFVNTYMSYYERQKVCKNLNMLAEKALGRIGTLYGENEIQSVVVLISNQQILQSGVKNIFLDDDFFTDSVTKWDFDEIQSVFALFVDYVENHMKDVLCLIANQEGDNRKKYWQGLLSVVDDFWRAVNGSFRKVLGLDENFEYSFLWQEEISCESDVQYLKKAVRKAMETITVTRREMYLNTALFIYDDEYIWIDTQLFKWILENSGLENIKHEILFNCKEEGILLTENNTRGYTTRMQSAGIRREYYKFYRYKFTDLGEVEIIDLAKGGEEVC